ncbi:hypothetical protein PHYBLDRAFT_172703 [Phycomyces blakesleeanus NRRL 1555(-)]|uniref:Uncharacterized protein n=1 Tax=Phycomyces blakesleeanus (strain ATCC 8743b / DSM 1359 / FGSC 10004 / NBRC 33097 / NRRL 1555) TaxID=763407 RepID=A0A167KTK9_PHYB8|nr:hypothetical protein PHYBLDRAFT_172703 [Phycomyces blakesleeanus NRRL 1555(-)]OAD68847.1 hypothetical protein PHYBLDRAFT_172703 [Phycomyces blakesleeanus NRRL 1555(-)]|eukprot:XP_018286887.1 hypothetical protein PHYBLDRAFT_172703 [Phycomyces blakesleeanus NRRL 1555(-)]
MFSFKFMYKDSQGKNINKNGSQALSHIIDENCHRFKTIEKRLTNEYKNCIKEFVAKDASVYVKDMIDYLVLVFGKINMSKETFKTFIVNECNLTFEKIYKQPIAKNSKKNIKVRYSWIM